MHFPPGMTVKRAACAVLRLSLVLIMMILYSLSFEKTLVIYSGPHSRYHCRFDFAPSPWQSPKLPQPATCSRNNRHPKSTVPRPRVPCYILRLPYSVAFESYAWKWHVKQVHTWRMANSSVMRSPDSKASNNGNGCCNHVHNTEVRPHQC